MIRIGHGFDVHKFGGQGPLTICGEKIDYPQGFLAHSANNNFVITAYTYDCSHVIPHHRAARGQRVKNDYEA